MNLTFTRVLPPEVWKYVRISMRAAGVYFALPFSSDVVVHNIHSPDFQLTCIWFK